MEACGHLCSSVSDDDQTVEVDYFNFRAPYPRVPTALIPPEEEQRPRRVRQIGHVITLAFGFFCAVVLALAFTSASTS